MPVIKDMLLLPNMLEENKMKRVMTAEPNRYMAMGSTGDASGMLLRQWRFPDTYADKETVWSSDHDRIISWDYDHWGECIGRVKAKTGKFGLENWFQNGKPTHILAFIVDALKANEKGTEHENTKWTGFRVLGTVNRSNGYPVYSLQLFAKDSKSKTKVYSDANAPNVKQQSIDHEMNGVFIGDYNGE